MGNTQELFAFANLVMSLVSVSICLCRLNSMTRRVLYRIRSKYAVALTAALASGLQPWWGEWPGWASLAMSASLVFGLCAGVAPWRSGPPSTACGPDEPECHL